MILTSAHICEYKSIVDSTVFTIAKLTCLVGKNEAGKTALLRALYKLNPIVQADGNFDVTHDYPRASVEDYRIEVEENRREPATVVTAIFTLDEEELSLIGELLGSNALVEPTLTVSKGYKNIREIYLQFDEEAIVHNLIKKFAIPEPLASQANEVTSLSGLLDFLEGNAAELADQASEAESHANAIEDESERASALQNLRVAGETEQAKALRAEIDRLLADEGLLLNVWHWCLKDALPKFLYFDDYYKMQGHDNVQALKQRKDTKTLKPSDHPLLGLIDMARLNLDELLAPKSTQELKNKLQGASNHLTKQVLNYWSQNTHLSMQFDVRQALPDDPMGMQTGTNIWGEIFDNRHLVSTLLSTRSAGFVWFFSFLAWYSSEKKRNQPLILLLDEPGLTLHGKAQEDLLRYFEEQILPKKNHQLIFTTHSPFMVDSRHFERVRIVQDNSIDAHDDLAIQDQGTKVFIDVLEAGPDSLFPLQGALGYEIYQTLFIGPNCLVVEGVSDLLYIQTVSGKLESEGRVGLDSRWTITPVGGSDKVPTFVALLGSQKKLNLATLIDYQKSDKQVIENLYKKRLLDKSRVLTYAHFTGKTEADVEDMFDPSFYLELVNAEYKRELTSVIKEADLISKADRILVRLELYLAANPLKSGHFNHYRPARFLTENTKSFTIPSATLDRFEAAFKRLNALLDS